MLLLINLAKKQEFRPISSKTANKPSNCCLYAGMNGKWAQILKFVAYMQDWIGFRLNFLFRLLFLLFKACPKLRFSTDTQ